MFELPHSTISDIAILAHTSKEHVARVMLGKSGVPVETQKRIMQTIKLLSKPDGKRLEDVFGVILNEHLAPDDYFSYVTFGIAERAEAHGLHMMLHIQSQEFESNYFDLLRRNKLANAFIIVAPYGYKAMTQYCQTHNIPAVLIDCHTGQENQKTAVIQSDNYSGARAAVEHLLSLGHKRIGHISGPLYVRSAAERARGYQDTLAEANIPFDRALMLEGNFTRDLGRIQARALLNLPKPPTAIFAASDLSALGVMDAAKEFGLVVGRDLSVVGFDDIGVCLKTSPTLTTVRQQMVEMGHYAGDTIARMMRGEKNIDGSRFFPTELVVRESTSLVKK